MHIKATGQHIGATDLYEGHQLQMELGNVKQGLVVQDHIFVPEPHFNRHGHAAHDFGQMRPNHTFGPTRGA